MDGIGALDGDGQGNVVLTERFLSFFPFGLCNVTIPGTYTVNAEGFGVLNVPSYSSVDCAFTTGNANPFPKWDFVFDDGAGKELDLVVEGQGVSEQGKLAKMK